MIRELKTLMAVARAGSFAAAGDKIGLTQAAVSAQMRRLENELGFALFERVGRSARINPKGQQILLQAQELLRLYGELGAPSAAVLSTTLVNIGAIASVQRSFLPKVLAKFHRQCLGCRTHVIPGLSMDLVDRVDAGEIDMAVIIRPPSSLQSDLRWTTLTSEPFRLIVPRGTPGNDWAKLLSSQPFIRYNRTSFGGRLADRFLRGMHFMPKEVCEADELEAIVELVANGVGVALVPQSPIQRSWPAAVRAIDLGPQTFHRDIGLVHRVTAQLSEPARMLAQLLVSQAQSGPLGGKSGTPARDSRAGVRPRHSRKLGR